MAVGSNSSSVLAEVVRVCRVAGVRAIGSRRVRELSGRHWLRSRLAAGCSTEAALIVLQLGRNTTAVRSVTNERHDRTHLIHQNSLGLWVGVVHGSLNDVVGKRIAHHSLQVDPVAHLEDERTTSFFASTAKALLNDVGAEFLTGQDSDVSDEALTERLRELRLAKIHDVLDDVVAKGVLHEGEAVLRDRCN